MRNVGVTNACPYMQDDTRFEMTFLRNGEQRNMSDQEMLQRKIGDDRFTMTLEDRDCVRETHPVIDSVEAREVTIGAIGVLDSVEKRRFTSFYDSKVRGDCVIHDERDVQSFSMRAGHSSPDWKSQQQWQFESGRWEWTLNLAHVGGPDRSVSVELKIPHPIFPGAPGSGHSSWYLWAPTNGAPFEHDYGIKSFHHCQCIDEKTDIPLPLFSLYTHGQQADMGFSYLLPPDQTWYVDVTFNQRTWLTVFHFRHIGLFEGAAPTLRLWCFSHEGDWRPALGRAREWFPNLFAPVAGQERIDGNMVYAIPMRPERRIAEWSDKMNLRWHEMAHYSTFGDFAPEEPFNADQFKGPKTPNYAVNDLTYERVNDYIEMCHRHGVAVMPYFNVTDCESELARTRFPESIARLTSGEEMVTWRYYDGVHYTLLMNCDPTYPYFNFVIEQYETLLKRWPDIDGFFFDQVGYGWLDTAHFDGQTYFENKPAYNLVNMYLRAFREIRRRFPRPRIIGMGNGVCRWQLMEFVDGNMAEGFPEFLGSAALLCPERPTICLAEGELAFQSALRYGSWVHVSPYDMASGDEPLPADAVELFAAYGPLIEFLRGRQWVYQPRPIEIQINSPSIYRAPLLGYYDRVPANIFKTPWGGYLTTILAVPTGSFAADDAPGRVTARIRLADAERLKCALIFGADYKGYYIARPEPLEDGRIDVPLPRHGAASMVVLAESLDVINSAGPWQILDQERIG